MNIYIIVFAISIALAQICKPIWFWLRQRRFDLHYFLDSSGMPSAHAAGVTSIATMAACQEGLNSSLFGALFGLTFFVLYDAMGVRREAGQHAHLLNQYMRLNPKVAKQVHFHHLKERIGHTPWQVLGGIILGSVVSIVVFLGV